MDSRPPFPPFTEETAIQIVHLAEDGWNTRVLPLKFNP
jgi:nuclear transport factor 2 (NTF2) superfamily protein